MISEIFLEQHGILSISSVYDGGEKVMIIFKFANDKQIIKQVTPNFINENEIFWEKYTLKIIKEENVKLRKLKLNKISKNYE